MRMNSPSLYLIITLLAITLNMACSISIVNPTVESQEEQIREQLRILEELSSELETATHQLESYLDETRRHPNDQETHIKEIQQRFLTLQRQHQRLQKEIISWEQNLKANKELSFEQSL